MYEGSVAVLEGGRLGGDERGSKSEAISVAGESMWWEANVISVPYTIPYTIIYIIQENIKYRIQNRIQPEYGNTG